MYESFHLIVLSLTSFQTLNIKCLADNRDEAQVAQSNSNTGSSLATPEAFQDAKTVLKEITAEINEIRNQIFEIRRESNGEHLPKGAQTYFDFDQVRIISCACPAAHTLASFIGRLPSITARWWSHC